MTSERQRESVALQCVAVKGFPLNVTHTEVANFLNIHLGTFGGHVVKLDTFVVTAEYGDKFQSLGQTYKWVVLSDSYQGW